MANPDNSTARLNRRHAIGAIAVASLIPTSAVAAAVCPNDPVFTMIEAHRAANVALIAAIDRQAEAEQAEPHRGSPRVKLGTTKPSSYTFDGKTVEIPPSDFCARSREEVENHINAKLAELGPDASQERVALLVRRYDLLAEFAKQEAECATPARDAAEEATSAAHEAEANALAVLLTTPPTTLGGAVALLRYLASKPDGFDYCSPNGESASGALVSSLIATLAPMVRQ